MVRITNSDKLTQLFYFIFYYLSLIKDTENRGTLDMLLVENFVKNHANEQLNLEFIQRVIDRVQADNVEE